MKTRFNSFDIVCCVSELQRLVGTRVNNVYDIDNKTYLIKLHRSEEKFVLLLESGSRIHLTNFEWPKNVAPSGFSMKLRKHLKNKRLESLKQMGLDRVIDLQFGSGEAAYHVILELYDRGNIILTDYEMIILNVLRPHTEGDKVKFAVREKYPQSRGRDKSLITIEQLKLILENGQLGDPIKKVLIFQLDFGPSLIEHVLLMHNFTNASKLGKTFNMDNDIQELFAAIQDANLIVQEAKTQTYKGYLIQKKEERVSTDLNAAKEYFYSNQEFHPMLFNQVKTLPFQEYETFNVAVDEFFSTLEGQKIELKIFQQEKEAMKKLQNIKKDHNHRLTELEKAQESDKHKAELITRNKELIDSAILAIQSALANQMSWMDIDNLVKDATAKGDPVAKHIKQLKLDTNHISMYLSDPFEDDVNLSGSDIENCLASCIIDIDLALSAFANARSYYDKKRHAAKKQQKTVESQGKAIKSAEKKTKQTLKDVQTISNIHKARKVFWFEKFFWFISSENFLVIAGRDQQQNELIVKRYMKPKDIYVHADIHGASSVIIKNPTGLPVPPKTLNEAGTMAICYSVAWEAKVISNAYWVYGEQVSKSAPTGEYLTTGSFMIRDKKNFLPPVQLSLGISFLFRLEDGYVSKHLGERKVIDTEEPVALSETDGENNEVEIEIADDSDNDEEQKLEPPEEQLNEQNSNSDDDISKFPDTQIRIYHTEGTKINVIAEPINPSTKMHKLPDVQVTEQKSSVRFKSSVKKQKDNENEHKQKSEATVLEQKDDNVKIGPAKRGQRGKLKKIKEKYRDQDEEERRLRMEILQSAGAAKVSKKSKKLKDNQNVKNVKVPQMPKIQNQENKDKEEEESLVHVEVDMINALTGKPFPEDELLFAIPVIAPYNTLSTYKFKVKLTPGTGRRGKAAKTAVSMFLKHRSATQREKDLLRAVKEEQLARNIPGKVKLSAPKLQTLKN